MNDYDSIKEVLESYRGQLPAPEPAWPQNVHKALGFIILHLFNQRLTVRWMKEQCHLNSHNFSARFRHYLGHTPKQYILHHRIAVAKALLSKDELKNMSISEIAYELGFSGVSTFSKAFKHITGTTPLHWQKEHID